MNETTPNNPAAPSTPNTQQLPSQATPRIPRGVRLMNPGNIVKTGINWQGEKQNLLEEKFETFHTPQAGIRALCKLLLNYQNKHDLNTVRGIISRWAPPIENDTEGYIRLVCLALGVTDDKPITLQNPVMLSRLATAIIRHENGQQPYTAAMIADAANAAITGRAPTTDVEVTITDPGRKAPESLTDVKDDDLLSLTRQFAAAGAIVQTTRQPNGLYTLLATYH